MALGTWRFFFACLVVISHLWQGMIHGPAAYAVWGFFLISGYLMTFVLQTKYANGIQGLINYSINRFLRIYPAYYVACLLGFIALILMPQFGVNPALLNGQFVLPDGWRDWITNIILLPVFSGNNLLVPVSGALGVEVAAYLLMPLMAKSPAVAWLGFILSGLTNCKYGFETNEFPERYSLFLPVYLAFSAGSLVAHYRDRMKEYASPLFSSAAWLAHCLIWLHWDQWPWTFGLYTSIVLSAWVLVSFADRTSNKIDQHLGELSYPVYLFHTVMAIWWMGFFDMQRTFGFFLVGMITTLILSTAVIRWVDRPLEKMKRKKAN